MSFQTLSSRPCIPFSSPELGLVPRSHSPRSRPTSLSFFFPLPLLPSSSLWSVCSFAQLSPAPLAPHAYAPNPRLRGGPADARQSWQGPREKPRSSSLANHCLSQRKLISTEEHHPVCVRRNRPRERLRLVFGC